MVRYIILLNNKVNGEKARAISIKKIYNKGSGINIWRPQTLKNVKMKLVGKMWGSQTLIIML